MESNENILHLDELVIGRHEYDIALNSAYFASIEKSEVVGGAVEAHVVLRLFERSYTVHIHAAGMVELICDRCLDKMAYEMEAEDDFRSDEMDGDIASEGGKTLDLNWLTYELIITNLPIVHSHPEGECNPAMQELLQTHLCSAQAEPEEE